jgi:osmotically-inducible protein OsmY
MGMQRNPVREAAISSAIIGRLIADKRVGDQPVSPLVVGNDVYLVGRVQTLEQRDMVEFIVRGTPGVGRVNTDELEVAELVPSALVRI